jgi:hypothetical protein
MEEANTRQLVSRARKHIAKGPRAHASSIEQRRLLEVFICAAEKGELDALEHLLTEDVVSYSDMGWYAWHVSQFGRERVEKSTATVA